MEIADDSASFSPSFSIYSGDRLAEIADRVGRRFAEEDDYYIENGDDGFEFEILQGASSSGDVFPVFDQKMISAKPEAGLTPLKDLLLRDPPAPQQTCDSSSEEDEALPSEMYCPSGGCRKSKSTGSSSTSAWSTRRWRIRDLLRRSHSDGSSINRDESRVKKKEREKVSSAHEIFYLRNKALKEDDKRKSYLPYKQQLFGLFANINPYRKPFPPF